MIKLKIRETRTLTTPRSIFAREDLDEIGNTAAVEVKERVAFEGTDSDGALMTSPAKVGSLSLGGYYTEAYADRKSKLGGRISPRNLVVTGRFLKSLHAWGATTQHVFVGFTAQRSKLLAEVHGSNSDFLGLTRKNAEVVQHKVEERLAARLKSLVYTRVK